MASAEAEPPGSLEALADKLRLVEAERERLAMAYAAGEESE